MSLLAVFIYFPFLALVPATIFGIFFFKKGKIKTVALTSILWLLYGIYESWLHYSCPYCDIRIDLVLIYPILIVFTIAAIIMIIAKSRKSS